MELVIVERAFGEPVEFQSLQDLEDKAAWCLELHGVRFLRTFLSSDGRRMICLYEAPDAEAVRKSQRTAGLPFERVWTATAYEAGG
ncbi:MAG: DUF4242 domain-containing protein [Myxococcales bacterium]|nr:DUF4242 domain-containing protein [Myxococcales bacterium]